MGECEPEVNNMWNTCGAERSADRSTSMIFAPSSRSRAPEKMSLCAAGAGLPTYSLQMRALRSPTVQDGNTSVVKSTTEGFAGFFMITLTTASPVPPVGADSCSDEDVIVSTGGRVLSRSAARCGHD